MGQDDWKRSRDTKASVSPELEDVDLSWDDDEAPSSLDLDLADDDEAFNRVTAIPDIPNEVLAKRLMERAEAETEPPPKPATPSATQHLPTLEFEPQLYDPDHDEPTLKVDADDLQRSVQARAAEGPELSFEFTEAADEDRVSTAASAPDASGDAAFRTAPANLPSDFPPALGLPQARKEGAPTAGEAETERPQPAHVRPRTRLATSELMLELDDPQAPGSALELAENAPVVDHDDSDSLELELRAEDLEAPRTDKDSAHSDMRDRFAMGDFTGALVVAEGILESDQTDADAQKCAQRCREVLTQMYAARLGPMSQTVAVAIPNDEIRWLSLDHRAGFLLSLVDGSLTLEEILDISGMSKLDALRLMYTLFDQRVITLQ